MKTPTQPIQALIYVALFSIMVWVLYSGSFSLWKSQIPGTGEDGAKNYFTAAYQLEHGVEVTQFEGMNYPFGEHVVFTDNQPLITLLLKVFGGTIDWIFYLPFLSGLFGGWCIYLLVRGHNVDFRFAILASLGVVFLSPQILRFGGHYSLAYIGIIPIFMWTISDANSHHFKNLLAFVIAIASAFVHPYLMMMLVLYWACHLLFNQAKSQNLLSWKSWLRTTLLPIAPIIVFQLVLVLTDVVNDRPSSPYGFLNYRATWSSIFLPLDFGYFSEISNSFEQSQEGGAFVGWFALCGLLAGIWNYIKTRKLDSSYVLFIASIPILLLSVAFPFYLWKLDRLLDYLGPLQQFRGIARFAFVFYYAANIFAIVQVWKLIRSNGPLLKSMSLAALVLLFAIDVWSLRNQVVDKTSEGSNVFHTEQVANALKEIDLKEFQAIVPLPYFHVGSENFRTKEIDGIREMCFALSLESGLPLTGVQMSRTSMSQTLMQLELMSYLGREPSILSEYPSNTSLLLVIKDHEPLSESELSLIENSSRMVSLDGYTLRTLKLSSIQEIIEKNKRSLSSRQDSANTKPILYRETFDADSTLLSFAGPSAKQVQRIDWTDVIDPKLKYDEGERYELSFWFYAGDQHAVNTQVWLWERNEKDEDVRFELSEVGDHIEQVMEDWLLFTMPIGVSNADNKIQIMLHRDGVNMDIWFDEVMLRNIKYDYFKEGPLNLNNRYIELPR